MSKTFSVPFDIGDKIYYIARKGKVVKCESCGRGKHESVFEMRVGTLEHLTIYYDKEYTSISYHVHTPGVENIYSSSEGEFVDSEDAFISERACLQAMQQLEEVERGGQGAKD